MGLSDYRIPVALNVFVFVCFFVIYIIKYRRQNLLCFELMAIPIAFLGLFFDDLIFPLSPAFTTLNSVSSEAVRVKSEYIQMISFFSLLLGCSVGNDSSPIHRSTYNSSTLNRISFNTLSNVLVIVLLIVIVYDYIGGVFSSWFYYSNSEIMDVDDRNKGLGHITCLILAISCVEIVRLRERNVDGLISFIKHVNKFYLAEWIGISALLYLSGNRNEMLLILLPVVVGYSICIKKIPNKLLIISFIAGAVLMAAAGMTRMDSVSLSGSEINIVALTRDFAGLGYNTDYLIDYSDRIGHTNFQEVPVQLLSGIPYIGYFLISTFGIKGPLPSAQLCTDSIYMASSGLGTSLIGDMYYTAGFLWVVIYMFIFGYIMSRLYNSDKNMNIYWLIFYTYMVSNAVYYIRSSWTFPITEIEYAIIIVFLGQLVCRKWLKTV